MALEVIAKPPVVFALKMENIRKEPNEAATCSGLKLLSLKQSSGTPMQVTIGQSEDVTRCPPIFNLLPEIWDLIFPYLTPTDFHSTINTCPEWKAIFKSETVDRLLPSFLRWRGVSKEARSVIDNILEASVSPTQCFKNLTTCLNKWAPDVEVEDSKESLRRVIESIKSRYIFKDARNLPIDPKNEAGVHRATSSVNPFLTKSLTIPLGGLTWFPENPDENRELNELTMSLVESYGHGITNISLSIWGELSIPLLFSFLSHLPNLKVLEMQGEFPLEARHAEEIGIWENQVHFGHLELLNIGVFSERHDEEETERFRVLTGGILASLLRRCGSQLKRLVCTAEFFEWGSNIREVNSERFPYLSCLRVRLIDLEFFDRLGGISGLPLEEIELAVNKYRGDNCPTVNDVLNSLRRFSSTLTSLQLCIPLMGEANLEVFGGFVVLPNLTKFTISLDSNYSMWSLSFIRMQAQQLTELVLVGENEDADLDQQEFNQLMQVFEVVPNLRKIIIRCGFDSDPDRWDEAEMIVVERGGLIERVKFKALSYYK